MAGDSPQIPLRIIDARIIVASEGGRISSSSSSSRTVSSPEPSAIGDPAARLFCVEVHTSRGVRTSRRSLGEFVTAHCALSRALLAAQKQQREAGDPPPKPEELPSLPSQWAEVSQPVAASRPDVHCQIEWNSEKQAAQPPHKLLNEWLAAAVAAVHAETAAADTVGPLHAILEPLLWASDGGDSNTPDSNVDNGNNDCNGGGGRTHAATADDVRRKLEAWLAGVPIGGNAASTSERTFDADPMVKFAMESGCDGQPAEEIYRQFVEHRVSAGEAAAALAVGAQESTVRSGHQKGAAASDVTAAATAAAAVAAAASPAKGCGGDVSALGAGGGAGAAGERLGMQYHLRVIVIMIGTSGLTEIYLRSEIPYGYLRRGAGTLWWCQSGPHPAHVSCSPCRRCRRGQPSNMAPDTVGAGHRCSCTQQCL
eukprot:COSAG01_NODE_8206_length_2874_cov_70.568649_2_plen_426_part_00